jgi:hypothetical protein
VWLSGTDFTIPDLVVATFAKTDHRMLGTAYSSGSCKLAAVLPQKSVHTVFQLTALYYYYALVYSCFVICFVFYLVIICHKSILLLFRILLFLVACFRSGLILLYILCQISVSILYCLSCICQSCLVYFLAIQHNLI